MISVALIPFLAAAAMAQSSALIPSNISTTCSSYLSTFNQDTSLSNCTAPLIDATAQFGATANTSTSPTSSSVTDALADLCTAKSSCSSETIQGKLASLYEACTTELTTSLNTDVLRTYDVLYSILPLANAMCSKDGNGDYCVMDIVESASNASSSGTNDAAASAASGAFYGITQYLWSSPSNSSSSLARRAAQQPIAIIPNVTTFGQYNILYLFLSASMSSSDLCTPCTRNVLLAYIDFESNVPYAPGLAVSLLLKGQTELYEGVLQTCGASFLNAAAEAAGSLSGGLMSGAPRSVDIVTNAIVLLAVAGASVLALMSLL